MQVRAGEQKGQDAKPEEKDSGLPDVVGAGTSDPNRFYLHTKHILNRVEEALFASPVLMRPNPQNFGYLYHFPPLAMPARLAPEGKRAPLEVLQKILKDIRTPVTLPPLCEPAEPGRADPADPRLKKPNPLLLLSGHTSWFHVIRECLTLREYMFISRLNHPMRKLTLEASQYWQKRFKLLCLGPHIFVPVYSNAILRRWVKVLYLQQALAHFKRNLDLDLNEARTFEQPVRETAVNGLTTRFRSRTHQCGLCLADVPFSLHLDSNHKKVVDIVQMACPACFATKLWTSKQAATLWGIPRTKLKDVACWRLPSVLWYSTPDLYEAWVQMDLSQRKLDRQLITPELACRYKDLPAKVRETVTLHKKEVDSTGSLPPEFDLESALGLFKDDDVDGLTYMQGEVKGESKGEAKPSQTVRPTLPPPPPRGQGPVYWLSYLKREALSVDLKKEFHDAPPVVLLPPLSHVFLPGGLTAAEPIDKGKSPGDEKQSVASAAPGSAP